MKELSRRSFLKAAAAGLGGVAAFGAMGTVGAFGEGEPTGKPAEGCLYIPGTYSAKSEGIGEVTVTMTFDANSITDVVLDVSNETPGIGGAAAEQIRRQLLETQGTEIDGVTGATVTTDSVRRAADACIAQAKGETVLIAEETPSNYGTFDEKGLYVPDFLQKQEPIKEDQYAEELSADVVIIGMGSAGIHAARAAMEEGKSVIILEKGESWHVRSHQVGCVNSSIQKQYGVELSDEEKRDLIAAIQVQNCSRPVMGMWKHYIEHSGEDVDWFLSAVPNYIVLPPDDIRTPTVEYTSAVDGKKKIRHITQYKGIAEAVDEEEFVPYLTIFNQPANPQYDYRDELYPMFRTAMLFEPGQAYYASYVVDMLNASGRVTTRFKTWGRQLLTDGTGRVVGVAAQDIDGRYIKINAACGVILTTGDYSSNIRMRDYFLKESMEYDSWMWSDTDANGVKCNQGEGITMGVNVGAKVQTSPHACMSHSRGGILGCDPFLLVNKHGKRFMNEDVPGHLWSPAVIQQPGKVMYQIFDDDWDKELGSFAVGHSCYWKCVEEDADIPWGLWMDSIGYIKRSTVEKGATWTANSIEELATKMGVPVQQLKATVDRYNELAHKGADDDYGKRADRLFPIEKAPFYCSEITSPISFAILGGLMCDEDAHVLNGETREPIPGLYAAGNIMGNRFGCDYPCVAMGVSHGFAICYGRLAGRNAANKV